MLWPLIPIAALVLVGLAAAAKATQGGQSKAPQPNDPPPAPNKPIGPNRIEGLPADVAQAITEATASNDPARIRAIAERLADKYTLQAAHLLDLATRLEGTPDGGASDQW